ncbi:unnamed protein product [Rotaria sordida]|uniref:Uncharacterized protein n=1 Tax=Rotaria sordida TaxID=392033 RepID=A0A819NIS3_9BILA|nr:unnamed protein product [Rotaria sordida]CAF1289866.1 unnamed protein product [Rotaria sordida]CAF3673096.1 unnamed protein product [Rotaria sordida]CAF3999670.1 unnamed protein product [Rotaria sordida]
MNIEICITLFLGIRKSKTKSFKQSFILFLDKRSLSKLNMSQICRLIPRTTWSVLYISRMSAHNLPPGTPIKVYEAKSGHHIVSGSGQFIATDGPSTT